MTMTKRITVAVLSTVLLATAASAASELPRILVYGDSVSGTRARWIAKHMEGVADIITLSYNGGSVGRALRYYEHTLKTKGPFDIVAFNCGIWDMGTADDVYRRDIGKFADMIATGGSFPVWVNTTPRFSDKKTRKHVTESIIRHNKIAAEEMQERGIPIIDVYTPFSIEDHAAMQSDGCHYTQDGHDVMGKLVADELKKLIGAFQILPHPLSPADEKFEWEHRFNAINGKSPLRWSLASGELPKGLTLDPASGVMAGRPVAAGEFAFNLRCVDSTGKIADAQFTLSVTPYSNSVPVIKAPALSDAVKGVYYHQQLECENGNGTISWHVKGGALPAGLELNERTGALEGTPRTAGEYTVSVTAADEEGDVSASQDVRVRVLSPPEKTVEVYATHDRSLDGRYTPTDKLMETSRGLIVLKFDMWEVPQDAQIKRARLRLYHQKCRSAFSLEARAMDNYLRRNKGQWTQENIDRVSAPKSGPPIGNVDIAAGVEAGDLLIDVTEYIRKRHADDRIVSIYLSSVMSVKICSLETEDIAKRPVLLIEY